MFCLIIAVISIIATAYFDLDKELLIWVLLALMVLK